MDHSKEEGRTAGKDYPTRNVKVVNIRGVMHLFFDRLSKSPDSLSFGGFFFVHGRGRYDIGARETQESGNHANARSVPLTI